jgi:hypothetical protein
MTRALKETSLPKRSSGRFGLSNDPPSPRLVRAQDEQLDHKLLSEGTSGTQKTIDIVTIL